MYVVEVSKDKAIVGVARILGQKKGRARCGILRNQTTKYATSLSCGMDTRVSTAPVPLVRKAYHADNRLSNIYRIMAWACVYKIVKY